MSSYGHCTFFFSGVSKAFTVSEVKDLGLHCLSIHPVCGTFARSLQSHSAHFHYPNSQVLCILAGGS